MPSSKAKKRTNNNKKRSAEEEGEELEKEEKGKVDDNNSNHARTTRTATTRGGKKAKVTAAESSVTKTKTTRTRATATKKKETNTKTNKEKSPKDIYFEKWKKFIKDNNFLGAMFVRGYKDDNTSDDDNDDDDDEDENYEPTEEEMKRVHYIMVDKKRDKAIKKMAELVLGVEGDDNYMNFTTQYSYQIYDGFYRVVKPFFDNKRNDKKAKLPDKFNMLLGFTYYIKKWESWTIDNEGGMEKMIKDLGILWKQLLDQQQHSDEDLGIDSEYTRPGIIALLEDFKKLVESVDMEDWPPYKFDFM